MNLDRAERHLLARAVMWILAARLGLRVLPYRTASLLFERISKRATHGNACSAETVRWAMTAAARRLPGTRCLAWALACHGLLSEAGLASAVRIGVAKAADGRLQAHAWVECCGKSLSWGDDESAYAPLASALDGEP